MKRIIFLLTLLAPFNFALASDYEHLDDASYVLLIDQDTREVLVERHADRKIAPSSMTKLMTAYVVFDQIKKGRINLSNKCFIGKDAWRKGGSTMFLNYGDIVTIDELITGLLVVSGNDAAVALAEVTSGTVSDFANLMNQTAKEIGLKNSHFMNPHGLNQDEHYMSLRDLAILTIRLRQDFPQYAHYFAISDFTYGNITQRNRNPLIKKDYEGVTGMKTGHTNDGGYGMVATATRGSRRLIAVTNENRTHRLREQVITELLDYGFDNYKKITFYNKNQPIAKVKTWIGKKTWADVISNSDVAVTLPKNYDISNLELKVKYQGPVYTPITAGSKIATLIIEAKGKKIREISLFAKENIDKAGYFKRIYDITKYKLQQFFNQV